MATPSSSTSCQMLREAYLQCMASFAQVTSSSAAPSQQMSCDQAFQFAVQAQKTAPYSFLRNIQIARQASDSTPDTQSYDILTLPQFKCLLKCAMKPASEQEDAACKTDCLFNKSHSAFTPQKKPA
jgi:hypothetical protein